MDAPFYHLDGVIHSRLEQENFDGPLDLILQLLSKNKMEIQDIQISLILEQYLAWMNRQKEVDLEIASEFITIAAYLVYLKTKTLLALREEETISEVEELIASLEARQRSENYAKIQQVIGILHQRYNTGKNYLVKHQESIRPDQTYHYQHQPEELPNALRKMLLRAEEKLPPSASDFEGIVAREPYPVEQKTDEILINLTQSGGISFHTLFQGSKSRSEVVATFLAVLELCRKKKIYLTGHGAECILNQTDEQPLEA